MTNGGKIRTQFATIVVGGDEKRPYYDILWIDEDGEYHIGYGSFNLKFVRNWLKSNFEVDPGYKAELEACPVCKKRPRVRYCCGEYFVSSEDGDCPCCGTAFTEMHSSRKQEVAAWNQRAAEWQRKQTNGDRLRSRSDEELAKLLYGMEDTYCQNLPECGEMLDSDEGIPEEKCLGCIVKWLRDRAEDGK